ncbi:MAG: hypothetical protein GY873_35315, partial [Bosea sp.]|nr:hypothetical protein [Bosea sp. (in: a-proteobacteria)]
VALMERAAIAAAADACLAGPPQVDSVRVVNVIGWRYRNAPRFLAERLGIHHILIPPDAGLLSAVGLGHAVRERTIEHTLLAPLREADVASLLQPAEEAALEAARELGCDDPVIRRRQWRCRLLGQDATIDLDLGAEDASDATVIERTFTAAFEDLYGRTPAGQPIELAAIRILAGDPEPQPTSADSPRDPALDAGASVTGPHLLPLD